MEIFIELVNHSVPFAFAFSDFIEFFFDVSSEVIIDDCFKELNQESVDEYAYICWNEFSFLVADSFFSCLFSYLVFLESEDFIVAYFTLDVFLFNVASLLYCRDCWSVS